MASFPSPAYSVVDDDSLLTVLQGYPNLIMWIAGHRPMKHRHALNPPC